MEALGYFAITCAGLAVFWWRQLRYRGTAREIFAMFDEDARGILERGRQEAESRQQPLLLSHLVLAATESPNIKEAVVKLGSSAESVADIARRDLGRPGDDYEVRGHSAVEAVHLALATASQNRRLATVVDLWAGVARTAEAELLLGSEVSVQGVLFYLVHGVKESAAAFPDAGQAELFLLNDDYTPRELVTEILKDVFRLEGEQARQRMVAAHNEGRASLGFFPATKARGMLSECRERARQYAAPLWIRWEPGKRMLF